MNLAAAAESGVATTQQKPVVLGRISGLYGVKGWVKVHSFTDPREAILDYDEWLLGQEGDWSPAGFAEGRPQGKTIVARFDKVSNRDEAAELVDSLIAVYRDAMPATGIDEYYWSDLEGLNVKHKDGGHLGKVAYLLETGANDVLVVHNEDQERLIPFVTGDVVTAVDLTNGEITVDWEWE